MEKRKLNILERATKLNEKRLDYIVSRGLFSEESVAGVRALKEHDGRWLCWNAETGLVDIHLVEDGKRGALAIGCEMTEDEWNKMMTEDEFEPCHEVVHTDGEGLFEWRDCFHPVKGLPEIKYRYAKETQQGSLG